jgi:hypothetical protein
LPAPLALPTVAAISAAAIDTRGAAVGIGTRTAITAAAIRAVSANPSKALFSELTAIHHRRLGL